MKILKVIICLLAFSIGSNAQSFQFVESINLNHTVLGRQRVNKEFDLLRSFGYHLAIEYHYHSKNKHFIPQMYLMLLHFENQYYSRPPDNRGFIEEVYNNANYLVLGWRPIHVLARNKKIKYTTGMEIYFKTQESSRIRVTKVGPGSSLGEPTWEDETLNSFFVGFVATGSYTHKLQENIFWVPRFTFRVSNITLSKAELERVIGFELGVRFDMTK